MDIIYIDTCSYHLRNLIEEAITRYPSNRDLVLSILFVGKYAARQSFIELDSDEKFKMMLDMHEVEKEVTLYVTTENNALSLNERQQSESSSRCSSESRRKSHHNLRRTSASEEKS
ncbi:hypothetical protein Tco_0324463 [Tanacetum coccineum]